MSKLLFRLFLLLICFSAFAEPTDGNKKSHKKSDSSSEYPDYVTLDKSFTLDKAIELALNNNYDLMNQKAALMNASGQLKQAKGSYDIKFGLQSDYAQTFTPTDKNNPSARSGEEILYQTVKGQDFTTKAYLEKLFAFGINTRLNFQLQRNRQEYRDGVYALDPYYAAYGHPNYNNTGNLSLEVSVPLLKSFNSAVADNNLKLAKQNYEAMSLNLEDSISKVIMQTSENFWKFFIAYERVRELEKLVSKNQVRQKNISALVKAGVRNQNDSLRIQVNSLEAQRQLENAKIEYGTAKVNLAIQIGIPVEAVSDPEIVIPEINFENEFPKPEDFDQERLEKIALNRPDIMSLVKACDAANLKVKTSKINLRPDLDLKLSVGTNGASYGYGANKYFGSPLTNIRGLNYGGSLVFSLPVQNRTKKGDLLQAEADYTNALAKLNKQKNTFILQLQNTISALNSYKDTVQNAKNVLNLQRQVYENEQKRYDAGISSVDNLIQQDQNWLEANMNYYQIFETFLRYVMEYKYSTTGLITIDTRAETLYNLWPKQEEIRGEGKNE